MKQSQSDESQIDFGQPALSRFPKRHLSSQGEDQNVSRKPQGIADDGIGTRGKRNTCTVLCSH